MSIAQILRSCAAVALLGLFSLAITPRDLIHHCDQEHVDHHHPDGAAINGDLDCEVCATLVAIFSDRSSKPYLPILEARCFHFATLSSAIAFRDVGTPAARGPPTF